MPQNVADPSKIQNASTGEIPRHIDLLFPLLVAIVVMAMLAIHLPWAAGNPAPFGRDEPLHLRNALVIAQEVAQSPSSFFSIAAGHLPERIQQTVYPPLAYLMVSPLKALVLNQTDDYLASVASMTLFALILCLSIFFLAKRFTGGGLVGGIFGVLAALACAFSPIVFQQTHHFGPNLPAAAMAALCLALFFASEDFSKKSWTLAFAVACGLSMLTYYSVFLFIAGPVLVSLLVSSGIKEKTPILRYALWLLLAVAIAVAICLAFYLNSGIHIKLAGYWQLFFGSVRTGAEESDLATSASFFQALLYYPRTFFTSQMGTIAGIWTCIGILLAFTNRVRGRWHLLAVALIPIVFFTLFSSKWPERTLPAVPLLIVLATAGFSAVRGRRAMGIIMSILLMFLTIKAGVSPVLAETGKMVREDETNFRELTAPFRSMGERWGTENKEILFVGVAHNQMLYEYVSEMAHVPCVIVQAKTSPDFFRRFDEMKMAVLIRTDPEAPTWFTKEYLENVASLRSDLGPLDTAKELAGKVANGENQFEEIGRYRVRSADIIFHLRKMEATPMEADLLPESAASDTLMGL